MSVGNVFTHNTSGEILRLIKLRKSNINTFVQVDSNNNLIIKKVKWSVLQKSQLRLIRGFDNLEIIDTYL